MSLFDLMQHDITLKIQNGTRSDNASRLCDSCHHSTILKGSADSEEKVYCSEMPMGSNGQVPFKVIQCNSYSNKNAPSLNDMYKTAWYLRGDDEKKGEIGFIPYKKWRKENKEDHSIFD